MTPLKWTSTPPTEAGWYWQRPLSAVAPRVVWVDWAKTDEAVVKFLAVVGYVQGRGTGGGCGYLHSSGDVWWAGPIPPPAESRSDDPEAAGEEAT